MIRTRLYYGNLSLRAVTLCLPLLAFAIASFFRFSTNWIPVEIRPAAWWPYLILLAATEVIWAAASRELDLCRYEKLFVPTGKTRRLLTACGITYAPIITAMFFYRGFSFSRLFVVLNAISLVLLTWISQVCFRLLLQSRQENWLRKCRILLVGADSFAAQVAEKIQKNLFMPCEVVGVIRLRDQQSAIYGPAHYELDDVPKLALGNGFDDVVIALPPSRLGEIPALRSRLEPLSVPVRAVLDFGDSVTFSESLFGFGSTMMLDLQATPAESPTYLSIKRAFDIIFSILALLLTSPLTLLIALSIRLTSPGPVFFTQERVGLNGKTFQMFKFRTMHSCAKQETDNGWTVANDHRKTHLGAFLRRTSLDELPQFWNVLCGDMSVVGPRPERPYFVQKFLQEITSYNTRHYLKVGITGWAQVNGLRGDTSIHDRVEYDLYYMKHWSFTFDLHIILLTIVRGFSDHNAY